MKLPISKRLMACAAWVDPGQRVADIGTDHGYLAIYLLRSGRARRRRILPRSLWSGPGRTPGGSGCKPDSPSTNATAFGVCPGILMCC